MRQIVAVLINHGYDDLVERLHLRQTFQWGKRVIFRSKQVQVKQLTRAERIRHALEDLGATFIKFGQVISTRPDLVPADVVTELAKLQENVKQFPSEKAIELVEKELGEPVESLFAEFDPNPLAAGSLGQVHRAVHHDGTRLAVKIRRPDVVREVERDLSLMEQLAELVQRHIPEADVFDPVGLVGHFARTIRRELNFSRESRTVDEFSRLFSDDASLYVPKIYWELTNEAVLTMEFVDGCRIDDRDALEKIGVTPSQVVANGARIFMKQAFEIGLFHGDPHPGNIRVLDDGSICLLDYGMVGMLEDERREQLVDLMLAVTRKDVRAAVDLVLQIGEPRRSVDMPLLRADIREFVDNYYGLSLERISIANMMSDFVSVLARHAVRCPGDFMLLIRALVTLEGVGRELDPDFNLAEMLAPSIEKVVRERYNPRNIAARVSNEVRSLLRVAHELPYQISRTVEKLSKDELRIQLEHRGLDRLITELDRSSNRLAVGMVLSSLIVASAIALTTSVAPILIAIPFALSSFLGLWLVYGVLRSGRL
jgi:ubiquinone biosynthesis protein